MFANRRTPLAIACILLATLTAGAETRVPYPTQYVVQDTDVSSDSQQAQNVIFKHRRVAEAPHTPGSSGGFCASNGAGGQGIKGGATLFLVDSYCHIRESRLDAERSCYDHPSMPDPSGKVTKGGDIYGVPNPQCAKIKWLLELEQVSLEAYVGKGRWKAKARAFLPGFLAWIF